MRAKIYLIPENGESFFGMNSEREKYVEIDAMSMNCNMGVEGQERMRVELSGFVTDDIKAVEAALGYEIVPKGEIQRYKTALESIAHLLEAAKRNDTVLDYEIRKAKGIAEEALRGKVPPTPKIKTQEPKEIKIEPFKRQPREDVL